LLLGRDARRLLVLDDLELVRELAARGARLVGLAQRLVLGVAHPDDDDQPGDHEAGEHEHRRRHREPLDPAAARGERDRRVEEVPLARAERVAEPRGEPAGFIGGVAAPQHPLRAAARLPLLGCLPDLDLERGFFAPGLGPQPQLRPRRDQRLVDDLDGGARASIVGLRDQEARRHQLVDEPAHLGRRR
jgi:hypothetical protein